MSLASCLLATEVVAASEPDQLHPAALPVEVRAFKTYQPPQDFGKIDIADFDPETWKERARD